MTSDSDTRRMAETGTGSGRSRGSAGLAEASPILPCLTHSVSDDGIQIPAPEETSDVE